MITEVLEHLKDQYFALREIRRVLKKGGRLIITVPKRRIFNIFSPITHVQHFREYNEKRILAILEGEGYEVKEVIIGGCFYDLLNLWHHLLKKYLLRKIDINGVFKEKIDKSWYKDYNGKGTDILILAFNQKNVR